MIILVEKVLIAALLLPVDVEGSGIIANPDAFHFPLVHRVLRVHNKTSYLPLVWVRQDRLWLPFSIWTLAVLNRPLKIRMKFLPFQMKMESPTVCSKHACPSVTTHLDLTPQ